MDETLTEAGMAVAELAVHQCLSHSGCTKLNIHGIEELVADKGYLGGAVLKRAKSYGGRSYLLEKGRGASVAGRPRPTRSKRSTSAAGECGEATARTC